jgi:hypothetical protein
MIGGLKPGKGGELLCDLLIYKTTEKHQAERKPAMKNNAPISLSAGAAAHLTDGAKVQEWPGH